MEDEIREQPKFNFGLLTLQRMNLAWTKVSFYSEDFAERGNFQSLNLKLENLETIFSELIGVEKSEKEQKRLMNDRKGYLKEIGNIMTVWSKAPKRYQNNFLMDIANAIKSYEFYLRREYGKKDLSMPSAEKIDKLMKELYNT